MEGESGKNAARTEIKFNFLLKKRSRDDSKAIVMVKKLSFLKLFAVGIAFTGTLFATAIDAIPVTNAYIGIAGAGGDFSSRTATFVVPDKSTTQVVKYGLRLYDLHVAKMIEVANDYCKDRENSYVIHWIYEAEDGKVFMGKYDLTCQFAKNTMKKFGTAAPESVTIDYAGNPETVKIATLNLNSKTAKEFASLVQSIEPTCIEGTPKICPGDRLE